MSRQVLGAVFTAACLVASTAWSQVALGVARTPGITVHRPDPPPEQPAPPSARSPHSHEHSASRPAPGSDLFLAGPDTYAPYDHRRPSRYPPYVLSGYAPTVYSPTVVETVIVQREIIIEREVRSPETTPNGDAAPDREPVVVYVTPAKPKTLYVIPRCYAGDKRPSADQLPAGCDLSALRVIPPAE